MTSIEQIKNGIQRYVDYDLSPGLPELAQAMIGGAVALYIAKAETILRRLSGEPYVAVLGIIDGDQVDVEAIHDAFAPRVKGTIPVKLPLIGSMSFDRAEVEKLFERIRSS